MGPLLQERSRAITCYSQQPPVEKVDVLGDTFQGCCVSYIAVANQTEGWGSVYIKVLHFHVSKSRFGVHHFPTPIK